MTSVLTAITHLPSRNIQDGARTFVGDEPIDFPLVLRQHAAYEDRLRACGAHVVTLNVNAGLPDSVFIEDTAVVLDEIAVMMSMGAASRRGEPAGVAPALSPYRPITWIPQAARIDGGDVVRSGRFLYVGESTRTTAQGIEHLRRLTKSHGYQVIAVPLRACLHLKTACSALPDGRFLVNAEWVDGGTLQPLSLLHVPSTEPWAADVLVVRDHILVSDAFPATIELLSTEGFDVTPTSVSEFAKAEGGVTCLSLVFES